MENRETIIKTKWLLLLYIPAFSLCAYFLLSWFHASWDSGVPVLHSLSPLISTAIDAGDMLTRQLQLTKHLHIAIGLLVILSVISTFFWKTLLLPTSITLGAFLLSQLLFNSNLFSFYYAFTALFLLASLIWISIRKLDLIETPPIQSRYLWLTLILIIGAIFRFYNLDSVPPGIIDEMAGNALLLKPYVEGAKNVLLAHFTSETPLTWLGNLSSMITVLYFKMFGFSALSLRFVSASVGVLAIWALYLLTRKLFGTRTALLAAFFFAVSSWVVFHSRSNYTHYIVVVLHGIIAFHLLLLALDRRKDWLFGLTGLVMGLSVYTYEPGKSTLLSTGLFGIIAFARRSKAGRKTTPVKQDIRQISILIISLALCLIPYVRMGLNDSMYFYTLAGSNQMNKAFWTHPDINLPSFVLSNVKQLLPTITHNRSAPPNAYTSDLFSNIKKGVLSPITTCLVIIGLAFVIRYARREACLLLLIWIVTAAAPALLTAVLPKRLMPLMPPIFILAGLGANTLVTSLSGDNNLRSWAKRVFASLGIGFILIFSAMQFRDLMKDVTYSSAYHRSYQQYRNEIKSAAAQTDLYTDIRNSVFVFILSGIPNYHYVRDLKGEALTILGRVKDTSKDISFLVSKHDPGNAILLNALGKLIPDSVRITADDFTLITFPRTRLVDIYGFTSAKKRSAENMIIEYEGALLVPAAGRYSITTTNGLPISITIDGNPVQLAGAANNGNAQDMWLSTGSHLITLHTRATDTPTLQWHRIGSETKNQQRPYICKRFVYDIPQFRGVVNRTVDLAWPRERYFQVTNSSGIIKGVDLWVGETDKMYITDPSLTQVIVLDPDGTELTTFSTGIYTPGMAMETGNGEIYVLKPWSNNGIEIYTADGRKQNTLPYVGNEMHTTPEGNIYLLRNHVLQFLNLSSSQNTKLRNVFFPPGPNPPFLIAMALGRDGRLYVLSADAKIYRLSPDHTVEEVFYIGAHSFTRDSQMTIDSENRLYITDFEKDLIHVFDEGGRALVGSSPQNNCPIQIDNPVDVMFRNNALYVLSRHSGKHWVSSFHIPPQ